MKCLHGKYEDAKVFTDELEENAHEQIITLLEQPFSRNAHIRIMPDVHSGTGCVIGYTAKKTDKIVPNLIGVDIGCGMCAWNLGKLSNIDFEKLDAVIREYVPSGRSINDKPDFDLTENIFNSLKETNYTFLQFMNDINTICQDMNQNRNYVYNSIGSLGGGNHFIELDKSNNGDVYLVIHSGSRNFGLKIANYHQHIAELRNDLSEGDMAIKIAYIKKTKSGKDISDAIMQLKQSKKVIKPTGLEYLEGYKAEDYYHDMKVAQIFAKISRRIMGYRILEKAFNKDYFTPVESVHNYIDFSDNIVRKGSISAHRGEKVIIPLNMAAGTIIGIGKGNEDWNYSAPHGAGRNFSRTQARKTISLEEFSESMNGIYSTCICDKTVDESPQAYKNADNIIKYVKDSVDITEILKPIYNFKATE